MYRFIALLLFVSACNGRLPPPAGSGDSDLPSNLPPGRICQQNNQCQSGYCIELPAGKACAATCSPHDECGPGLVCKQANGRHAASPTICVPPTITLCEPCETDMECGPFGDVCQRLGVDNDAFCTLDCSATQTCPQGFSCEPLRNDESEVVSHQCWPNANTCTCDELSAGAMRLCQKTTAGVGTCLGHETCTPPLGWTGCDARVPTEETCDTVDNDCDLDVDEDLAGAPLTRSCGYGPEPRRSECLGVETCSQGAFGACSLPTPPAVETVCDNADNDCDGAVDEDLLHSADSCTSCGDVCPPGPDFFESTTRACLQSAGDYYCGPIGCRAPYYDVDGIEQNGCEVEDDHTRVGSEIIINDTWSRAKRVTNSFISACGGSSTRSNLRLPHDSRTHTPTQPPSPNADYYLVESHDEGTFCVHETKMCLLFEPDAANLRAPGVVQMQVCWSNHYASSATSPSFPHCVTLDPHAANDRVTATFDTPDSPNTQFHYIRVRSVAARFSGTYRVAAFDDQGCPLY